MLGLTRAYLRSGIMQNGLVENANERMLLQ